MTECKYKGCSEQAWEKCPQGFCIYHSPDNGEDKAVARQVWEEARKRARDAERANFVGWHFPNDSTEKGFTGVVFSSLASFFGAVFEDFAHFNGAHFKGGTNFVKATFQNNCFFSKAIFKGDANFIEAAFQGHTCFDGASFHGCASFWDASFKAEANFVGAAFKAQSYFARIPIQERTNVVIDVPSWELPFNKATPFLHREQGEGLYRLAKQSAQQQGDYRRAGQYHFAEQCAIEYGRRKTCRCKLWHYFTEWFFARTIFGYGEKVHRPLIAGLVVILLWAGLYLGLHAIGPSRLEPAEFLQHEPTIGQCLYFSIVTFTTLGYGDMAPKPDFSLLASVEAVLGASLMAVFIVALTRKYMR